MTGGWVIGVSLNFVSALGTGLSKLAIRKSWIMERGTATHDGRKGHETRKAKDAAQRIRRTALLFMSLINPVFDVVAMYFASPSILAPFSGVALAFVVLFSTRLIGEKPGRQRTFAAVLIVVGEAIVALFGDHTSDDDVTLDELCASYREPLFLGFYGLTVVWMGILAYCMNCCKNAALKRFAWGFTGGYITGCESFIKDALTVVKASGEMFRPWRLPWYFFAMILVAIVNALGGLMILTRCMKRYDATYSSGMFAGGLVLSTSILSAIHYHTFDNISGLSYVLYPLGIAIVLLGVGILAHHTKDDFALEASTEMKSSSVDLHIPQAYEDELQNGQHQEASIRVRNRKDASHNHIL